MIKKQQKICIYAIFVVSLRHILVYASNETPFVVHILYANSLRFVRAGACQRGRSGDMERAGTGAVYRSDRHL